MPDIKSPGPSYSVAIFASESKVAFVRLDVDDPNENAAAKTAAMGYGLIGTIAIEDGTPKVHIQPGCAAAMALAGLAFAEILGSLLKRR